MHWVNLADISSFVFSRFSVLNLITHLKAFLDSNWVDLGVPRKLWMSGFENTIEIENPMVE